MDSHSADAAAIALMRKQHGHARVSQLHEIGLSRTQIALRVRKGVFTRVAYGVVCLAGATVTPLSRATRAVFAAGEGAVVCRWTAAQFHGLDAPRSSLTHVVIARATRTRRIDGVRIHRTRWLPDQHVTDLNRVPTTTLPRTIVDCATQLDHWTALAMLDSCSASAAIWRTIHGVAVRLSNGRPGVRAIAEATDPDSEQRLRSLLERRAADVLRERNVPEGGWNVKIFDEHGPIREVDLCYREQRLIVEIDGFRYHAGRQAAHRDRSTDRRLQLAGWRVLRFTSRDVMQRPAAMAHEIVRALDNR